MSPQLLASHAIPVVRVVHHPREFVVVGPGTYHRWGLLVSGWHLGCSGVDASGCRLLTSSASSAYTSAPLPHSAPTPQRLQPWLQRC